MRFRNVKVPEGINVSRHSPLLDLFLLAGTLLVGLGLLSVVLIWVGGSLARHLPMSWENRLADRVLQAPAAPESADEAPIAAALQALADRLAASMIEDEETRIVVHYLDDDRVNAFATLGGHVFVARGLIARVNSENALAMVLAHEIAHVVHRDVAAAMTGGLLLNLVYSLVLGQSSEELAAVLLGSGTLLSRGFSREAERDADAAALRALMATYGHIAGAEDLFAVLHAALREADMEEPPAILSTHPLTEERIERIRESAAAEGWPLDGDLTPLPGSLAGIGAAED